MGGNLNLGRFGEDLAEKYLLSLGYKILEKNFRKRYTEIDIVAIDKRVLVFIEVKTRIGDKFGNPRNAITPFKIRTLVRSANYYKLIHPEFPSSMRIDFVGVSLDVNYRLKDIELIKNITL